MLCIGLGYDAGLDEITLVTHEDERQFFCVFDSGDLFSKFCRLIEGFAVRQREDDKESLAGPYILVP